MDTTCDLLRLQALLGDIESADLFAETYQKALEKAAKQHDFKQIKQLKKVLSAQVLFMLAEYLTEEAKIKEIEERGEVQ